MQDVLAGFLMVAERQYGFGDLVRLDERDLASADARADGVEPPIPASAASSLPVP